MLDMYGYTKYTDPVIALCCGNTFRKGCITSWMHQSESCPICQSTEFGSRCTFVPLLPPTSGSLSHSLPALCARCGGDPPDLWSPLGSFTTLEVGSSESHELPNSSWMGPSGSGDPHGVGGTRSRALGFGKKSLHTSVFHTQIALHGATFGRSICCWRGERDPGPWHARTPAAALLPIV
jgi:hypothetical protein